MTEPLESGDAAISFIAPAKPIPGLDPDAYVRFFHTQITRAPDAPAYEPACESVCEKRDRAADALLFKRTTRVNALACDPDANAEAERIASALEDGSEFLGVAGAGLMGVSIAASFIAARVRVLVYDPVDAALATLRERLRRELALLRVALERNLPDPDAESAALDELLDSRLSATNAAPRLAEAAVVVESIPEKAKLKAKFYRDLDAAARRPIFLMTNTSSLRIDELSQSLAEDSDGRLTSRARFVGFHFFHPAVKRALVEIAVGERSCASALALASRLARIISKTPLVVSDAPGFLVNRLLQAYLNEILALLDEKVPIERLERLAERIGMERPPLRVLDEIGLDVSLRSGWSFLKAFPDRTHASRALETLCRVGRLGRKTRLGFYRYETSEPWREDATLDLDQAKLAELSESRDSGSSRDSSGYSDEALAARIAIAVFFEAARLVEEGVVGSLAEADAGSTLALGFPRAKGGACYWATASGLDRVITESRRWSFLGSRFVPPELVRALAEQERGR